MFPNENGQHLISLARVLVLIAFVLGMMLFVFQLTAANAETLGYRMIGKVCAGTHCLPRYSDDRVTGLYVCEARRALLADAASVHRMTAETSCIPILGHGRA